MKQLLAKIWFGLITLGLMVGFYHDPGFRLFTVTLLFILITMWSMSVLIKSYYDRNY